MDFQRDLTRKWPRLMPNTEHQSTFWSLKERIFSRRFGNIADGYDRWGWGLAEPNGLGQHFRKWLKDDIEAVHAIQEASWQSVASHHDLYPEALR
jgi:hypothetical protein